MVLVVRRERVSQRIEHSPLEHGMPKSMASAQKMSPGTAEDPDIEFSNDFPDESEYRGPAEFWDDIAARFTRVLREANDTLHLIRIDLPQDASPEWTQSEATRREKLIKHTLYSLCPKGLYMRAYWQLPIVRDSVITARWLVVGTTGEDDLWQEMKRIIHDAMTRLRVSWKEDGKDYGTIDDMVCWWHALESKLGSSPVMESELCDVALIDTPEEMIQAALAGKIDQSATMRVYFHPLAECSSEVAKSLASLWWEDVHDLAEEKKQAAAVILQGQGKPCIVCGVETPALSDPQYAVVKYLVEAGSSGASKDEIENVRSSARRILAELSKAAHWNRVIRMPGSTGRRYRIVCYQSETT